MTAPSRILRHVPQDVRDEDTKLHVARLRAGSGLTTEQHRALSQRDVALHALAESLRAFPAQDLERALVAMLCALPLTGAQMESLGDAISRAGHYRARGG
jgi:hypothetical protein